MIFNYKIANIVVLFFAFTFFLQAENNTLSFSKFDIQKEQFATRGGTYFFSKEQLAEAIEQLSYVKSDENVKITLLRSLIATIIQINKFYRQAYVYKMRCELRKERTGNRLTTLVETSVITENQERDNRYGYSLEQIEQFASKIVSIQNRGRHRLVIYRAYEHSNRNLIYATIPYFE